MRAVNSEGGGTESNTDTATTDTTVANAPTSLTATTVATDKTVMDLAWTAPTDDGGSAITEYQYRYVEGDTAGGTWTDTDSTTTSQRVTGLDKGTEYTFDVRAVNGVGQSAASGSATETTGTTVADPPTGLAVDASTTSVVFSWDAPTDDGGTDITEYQYRHAEGTSIPNTVAYQDTTATSVTISGLSPSAEYTFEVRAVNGVGIGNTEDTTATTDATVTISTDATKIYAGEVFDVDIAFSGDSTDLVAGDITVTDGTRGALTETDAQNYVLSVTAGSAGTLNVAIPEDVVSPGNAAADQDFTVNALTTPNAPTSLSATASATSMALSWTAPSDTGGAAITDYEVSVDSGAWVSTGSTSASHTVTGLDKGTEYTFKVRAVNSEGDGTASSTETATTSTTVPDAPTSLTVDVSETSADLSWTAPDDTGGTAITDYEVRHEEGSSVSDSTSWTSTGSTTASYTVSELMAGTEYTFEVRAVNAEGESDASAAVTETTDGSTTTPETETQLTGTYSEDLGYNVIPEALGALKRINSNGTVTSLGNLWYEERPYNVAMTRCLSFDDDLHVVMGYGDPRGLLKRDALASRADNAQHLVYGNKLRYIVPAFEANRSKYASLAELALKINATLFFANGLICIKDRNPFRAECDGATGTGTGNLGFDSENKTFPMSGYLKIGTEILAYTGVSSGAFTGMTRGVLGTDIANHANNSNIVYVDNVIAPDRIKRNGFSISTDTTRVFNAIRNSDNSLEECDPDSIAVYGELTYPLDLGLTQHELAWQASIFEQYLENLKDPHALIRLTLKPTNYLEAAQVVGVRREGLVYAVQIVSLTKGQTATEVRGRGGLGCCR